MMSLRAMLCGVALLLAAAALNGCAPGGDSQLDEEKDPHYQRGRNLVSSQDYKGAVEEFEKAIEANPRSASAHFELACLYDTKINDYAAAIYHYERHLKLLPDSERAATVRERIRGCKLELAKSEFPLPDSPNLQHEVDRLSAENLALKQQLAALRVQPIAPPARVEAVAAQPPTPVETARSTPPPASSHARVHIVKERETISSIAVQYGVKASAILSANPNVDPRRLRIGQSLNLP